MSSSAASAGARRLLTVEDIPRLISLLANRGYQIAGPTARDGAIVYDLLESADELPRGLTEEQEAGRYRLKERGDPALFGYTVGPQSWKKFLHPAEVRLYSASMKADSIRILTGPPGHTGPYALLGVRACDLAAITIQDRVLLGDRYVDGIYQERREAIFVLAVNCTQSSPTCFCASVGAGPRASSGYDLAVTEVVRPGTHILVAEAGSSLGAELLAELGAREAPEQLCAEADAAIASAAAQVRSLDSTGIRELLYANLEHPRWDDAAGRCLTCTNCTMVCPTCFCTNVEDATDVPGWSAGRWRRWDSCFSQAFSYIHGGSVRSSPRSRYRQWLTHKLASWIDQFGTSGCVGCGRCIAWCPAAIDITEEVRAIRESVPAGPAGGKGD